MSRINSREELENVLARNCKLGTKTVITNEMFEEVIQTVKKYGYITLQDLFIEPEAYNNLDPRTFFNVISYLDSRLCKYLQVYMGEGVCKTYANVMYKGDIYTFEMFFLSGTEATCRVNFDSKAKMTKFVNVHFIDEDFYFIGV